MVQQFLPAAVPILALAIGLWLPSTRNHRFIFFAITWTIVWVVAEASRSPFRPALMFVIVFALISPESIGLGSLTRRERAVDTVINEIEATRPGTASPAETLARIRTLTGGRDAARIVGARLRLLARSRLAPDSAVASLTPARYYNLAANRVLHDVRWRRVLGSKPQVTAWDEQIVLFGFHEQARGLIPTEALVERPVVELGRWTHEVDLLLNDLRAMPINDEVVDEARSRMVDAIRAEFALAQGERSTEVIKMQAETAEAMNDAWRRVKERVSTVVAE